MNNMKLNLPCRHHYAGKAGLAALVVAASMTIASSNALAAVVCGSANLPANVPITTAGIYVNFVTGTIGTTQASSPGWDFNPWGASGSLAFFTSTGAANTNALLGDGTANGTPSLLASGATIGPAGTYFAAGIAGNVATSPWRAGVSGGYAGVRFNNEATATTNYGWVRLNTTGPTTGFPATIVAYCYDNTGAAITAGTTPVSLQQFSVE